MSLVGECDFLNRTCSWINITLLLLEHHSFEQIPATATAVKYAPLIPPTQK